ncbi:probable serine/threonine-protein kinase kinX [Anopheles maculipalpis]|uniref:probable serine/threonine-protein kinase kinX n=1 Tax=Anopheles maculipalpis TaxID=1496333 RepID=UPI002159625A|nr:probable serine/threonine-protein kinase kinX [Anopheles maculipalpis]
MGKDSVREKDTAGNVAMTSGGRRSGRPVSASPYSENYRPPIDLCQRHLINHRLMVSKLTRRELEDKYLSLCDENYTIKKRFLEQEELIKRLKTKLTRLSNESNNRSKSRLDMASSEHYSRLHDLELQRRELHEKLEALRRATSTEGRRMESASKANSARTSAQRRSKSARPAKEPDVAGRRECKSSSPSNDGYDEEEEARHHRPVGAGGRRNSTDDRTEDDDEDSPGEMARRNSHRKSYGADDEEEDDDDDDENDERAGAVDEDRDVLSGGSEDLHGSDRRGSSRMETNGLVGGTKILNSKDRRQRSERSKPRQAQCPDCERHRTEQQTRETDLVKMKLNIKYLHKELQNEKEKSSLLARQLEEKLSYEIMKRNAAENLEILNLNRQVEDLAKELQRQVDEQKRSMEHEMRKQGDLEAQIRKEKDKNVSLFEECERLKKNIEKLKENMSEVEIERDFLKRQQENFTKIVDENKLLKYQLDELRKHNEELLKQIDTLKEEELVTKASQRELLEKLKTLQQDNDTLSVMLEGLRTENELLAEERTHLEHSLKSLEASPIKEVRPVSPIRLSENASVQTEREDKIDTQASSLEASKVFLKQPAPVERRVPARDTLPMALGPHSPSRSSVVARMSRERHAYETAEAIQLLSRQVSVSQMIPKLSQIMDNRTDEPSKPSNVELLIANSYPERLEQSFRENEQFYALQNAARRRDTDRASTISTASEKRRISFRDGTSNTKQSSVKDGEHSMQENYARFFNIQRLPSMWHKIAENPAGTASVSIPNRTFNTKQSIADTLTIKIRSVRWHESAVDRMLAAKVSLYYVEFTFLDLYGHRLETPHSAKFVSPDGGIQLEHTFDFNVTIELDAKRYAARCAQLKKMLHPAGNDGTVRFVVVNEDRTASGNPSEDIGYASVKLRSELQNVLKQNVSQMEIVTPIYDFEHEHDELGVLTVQFDNIKPLLSMMER